MKTIRLNGSPELENRIFYGHVTGPNKDLGGVNVALDEDVPGVGNSVAINPRSGLTIHRPFYETDLLSVASKDLHILNQE